MSKIIRGQGRVVRKPVVDAHREAAAVTERAAHQAAQIVASARKQAEAIQQEAKTRGRQEGYAEAAHVLTQAHAETSRAINNHQDAIAQLAIRCAERLVRGQLTLEPERIRNVVADLTERASRASQMTLRVHPDDVSAVGSLDHGAEIVSDANLERGECVLETNLGDLDARFAVQLDALERALCGAHD